MSVIPKKKRDYWNLFVIDKAFRHRPVCIFMKKMDQACNFIKKETLAQVYSYEFAKFLRTPFYIGGWWLLLDILQTPLTKHLWWLLLPGGYRKLSFRGFGRFSQSVTYMLQLIFLVWYFFNSVIKQNGTLFGKKLRKILVIVSLNVYLVHIANIFTFKCLALTKLLISRLIKR